ncbi:hypothetical protein BAY61_05575 [Prauserella marina]|uniref:Uncharacterized protein n=1 Tax=Prauserella marina TaxID=530584 RepID=A0A222VKX7_9PSEU|nr:hypothetical protein [Prauserella marina]ASR34547.1 hypothetical protein BAY61_05575 [Prauserella marina]PWV85842.1 hypothetical protein DES30_1011872 [Prauserella marina]SDC44171.1 hypothetical protein SAMN05421630_102120 [Prauserella marina]
MNSLARLADAIAEALGTHPSVVSLDGGEHGGLATYLPRRKVVGVRVTGEGEPVGIGVVLRLGEPFPAVADQLRELVRDIAGDVRVDVTIADVRPAEPG